MKDKIKYAEKLREEYSYHPQTKTNFDRLRELDAKVKKPANIFSYIFGSVGSLVLGTGMCIAMGVVGGLMPVGILVGLAGIGMVSSTYPLHKAILKSRKAKYADEIVRLSNEVVEVSDYQPDKQTTKTQQATYDTSRYDYKHNSRDNSIER